MKRTTLLASLLLAALVLCLASASAATAAGLKAALVEVRSEYEDASPPAAPSFFGVRHSPLDAFLRETLRSARPAVFAPPPSYDLRTLDRLTAIKDQNPYGTCWSFATYGSLESCLLPAETWDFSEDNMVRNSGFDWEAYDGGGNYWMSTAFLARRDGPVLETDDPYGDGVGPSPSTLAKQKHVQNVLILPGKQGTSCDEIKNAVMTHGAVATYMYAGAWASYFDFTHDAYYYPAGGGADSDHAVTIVGWDDAYPASNFKLGTRPPGDGAFIVRNSWGTGWGEDGYCYASYYDKYIGVDAWCFSGAEATDVHDGVCQYDPLGATNIYRSSGVTTWWLANVFSASETATVTAAGFYSFYAGLSYEVWAGATLASMTKRGSGVVAEAGYRTVDLTTPLPVTSGQTFAVAVKVTGGPGEEYLLTVEEPISGYSSGATASAGQSYISSNGSSWYDATAEISSGTNVCLKAFTASLPVGTFMLNGGKAYTKSTAVDLQANVFGASDMRFRDEGGPWTDWEAFAATRPWTLPSGDGLKTVEAEFNNARGTTAKADSIFVDTHRPATKAPYERSVRRNQYVRLSYRVSDATPCAAKATVTIRIKTLAGTTKKTLRLGKRYVNRLLSYRFRCSLPKRTYRYYVYATDAAGNRQRVLGWNYLYVR